MLLGYWALIGRGEVTEILTASSVMDWTELISTDKSILIWRNISVLKFQCWIHERKWLSVLQSCLYHPKISIPRPHGRITLGWAMPDAGRLSHSSTLSSLRSHRLSSLIIPRSLRRTSVYCLLVPTVRQKKVARSFPAHRSLAKIIAPPFFSPKSQKCADAAHPRRFSQDV